MSHPSGPPTWKQKDRALAIRCPECGARPGRFCSLPIDGDPGVHRRRLDKGEGLTDG